MVGVALAVRIDTLQHPNPTSDTIAL